MNRFTFRNWAIYAIGLVTLALASQTQAAPTTTGGPYIDFKGYLGTDLVGTNMVTTTVLWRLNLDHWPWVQYTASPVGGSYRVEIADGGLGTLNNSPDSPYRVVVGASYVTPSGDVNGGLRFTTIYGVDSNPTDPNSLAMTGYNHAAPQVTVSGEHVIGADGIDYLPAADLVQGLVRISDLGTYLGSSADLSPFLGAVDQSSAVWLFQTNIPEPAMTVVPEPASFFLFGLGAVVFLGRRRK